MLGLLARSYDQKKVMDKSNYYLMDELIPSHWKTTTLARACEGFLEAKLCQQQAIKTNVENAGHSLVKTAGASDTVLHLPN
jgi:hypothetical protein